MSEKELLPCGKSRSCGTSGHFSGSSIADELFEIGYSLGKDEIMLESIKNAEKNTSYTLEEIMKILEIPEKEQPKFAAML